MSCMSSQILLLTEKSSFDTSLSLKVPNKSSYNIDYEVDLKNVNIPNCILGVNFISENLNLKCVSHLLKINFYSLINQKKTLITVYIQNKTIKSDDPLHQTILFFHENNCDLGNKLNFLIDCSLQFKSDVICYDYYGFGKSEGEISIKNLLSLNSIIDFFVKKNININKTVIIGKNMGCIPAILLSNENQFKNCKGLILISPFFCKIINNNILKNVSCAKFIIQSKKNIHIYNEIKRIFNDVNNVYEWYNKSSDDENLFAPEGYRMKFIKKVKNFIDIINKKLNIMNLSLSQIFGNANTNSSSGNIANKMLENSDNSKFTFNSPLSPIEINHNLCNNNEEDHNVTFIKNKDENLLNDYNEDE